MPSDGGQFQHCILCGERVESFEEPVHRGDRPKNNITDICRVVRANRALMKVLELAEQTCEHHEAENYKVMQPDYIEVKLLEACQAARKELGK